MSNEIIKSALWQARRSIRSKLSDLEETAAEDREQLRYYQRKVKDYKAHLESTNQQKRKLRRELKKTEAIEYEINPIKNIQNAKVAQNV